MEADTDSTATGQRDRAHRGPRSSKLKRVASSLDFHAHTQSAPLARSHSPVCADAIRAAAIHRAIQLRDAGGATLKIKPNQTLQATPVDAGLVALARKSGVPELGR